MATDPQSLMTQGKCFACFGEANTFQIMKLALLAQAASSMNTDPQSLLAQAKCYVCMGVSMVEAMELALLADIATGGSGGGGTIQTISTADANPITAGITPADPTKGATFYQDPSSGSGTNVWLWSVGAQTWVQFSA